MAIKHPQAPQKIIIVAIAEIIVFRGAQWRCCGNRTATLDRERSVVPLFLRDEVERRARSVKRRGKNISQPLAFLDLGRSDVFHGTAPTPMAGRRSNRQINKGRQTQYCWNAVERSLRSVTE
jgi:hypothetical protein